MMQLQLLLWGAASVDGLFVACGPGFCELAPMSVVGWNCVLNHHTELHGDEGPYELMRGTR